MKKDTYEFNKTWEDDIHRHSVNWPKDIWQLITEEMKHTHTSAGEVIRRKIFESFCKDRLAGKRDFRESVEEWSLEKPKRFQGFTNLLQRHLGFLIKQRRLRERAQERAMVKKIFDQ